MCWERRIEEIEEGARWAWERWLDVPSAIRRRVTRTIQDWLGNEFIPFYSLYSTVRDIGEQFNEFARRVNFYRRNPERLRTEFIERMLPGTRYGELARLLSPGSEATYGTGDEISRPVILIPGMVGTRLFRTGASAVPPSSSLQPDEVSEWLERELRSDDSALLSRLPRSARDALRPVLTRLSDRHLYNPNAVWDPDSLHSMIHLMNKTASERGALFCPDLNNGGTACEPATEFAVKVAEMMTLRGVFSLLFGRDAERIARELMTILGIDTIENLFEDARFEALLQSRKRRGWCQPVWAISEHWLLPLERTFGDVIYAFGYDWREPLANSVERLVQKIERVKDLHDRKSPILVTHSFGGLVARAAAKSRPYNVGGIVQVFSPTAGSVKTYANFKKGGGCVIPPGWSEEYPPTDAQLSEFFNFDLLSSLLHFDIMDIGFSLYLGWDATAFATSSSGAYGAYSLLPNNVPRHQRSGHWLNIENDSALASLLRSTSNVYDLYRQFDQPWGLLDGTKWREGQSITVGEESERAWQWLQNNAGDAGSVVSFLHSLQQNGLLRTFTTEQLSAAQVRTIRRRVLHGINEAERLNASVGPWVHPNTWSMYATGRHTDVGFNIRRTGDPSSPYATHRIVSTEGDSSLEIDSARALSDRFAGEQHFTDVNHAHALSNSANVRSGLIKSVYLAMVAAHRADTGP